MAGSVRDIAIIVSVLLITLGAPTFATERANLPSPGDLNPCPDPSEPWWCLYDQEGFLALSWVLDDDHLAGATLGYGTRGHFEEGLRWKTLSASYQSHGGESVWGARRDWTILMPHASRWGGFGPLIAFGLEYRTGELHSGLGGYIGVGGQITMWSRGHWQFAIGLERDFGVSSESRNAVQATMAFAHPKLGARKYS
jgi:hypothetical protein